MFSFFSPFLLQVGAPQLLQLKNLFEHTIDAGLKLVERHRNKLTFPPSGHGLIQTLTSILSGFFDYIAAHGGFSRSTDSDDSQSMKGAKAVRILTVFRRQQSAAEMTLAKIFVQAYLWSFGAPFQQVRPHVKYFVDVESLISISFAFHRPHLKQKRKLLFYA